jgi:N-acyl-D-amino-acid deacylase
LEFDVLIRNGTVIDGSRNAKRWRADVGIVGDQIEAVGTLDGATAATEIDASGRIVSPGFIDVHVHSEIALIGVPHRYGGLYQGVTTHLMAPDGFGWAPLPPDKAAALWESTLFAYGATAVLPDTSSPEAFLAGFAGRTPANLVPQVPHCAVRLAVKGWETEPASPAEVKQMERLVSEWMDAGAVSLCVGLDYQPSAFSDLNELVALSKIVAGFGGVYASHQRYSMLGAAAAWRETMQIGESAGIGVHVSHAAVNDLTRPLLEEAKDRCDLTFESYMYPAGCTHLAMMLNMDDQVGGPAGVRARLQTPAERRRIGAYLNENGRLASDDPDGRVGVIAVSQTGRYVGMTLPDAAKSEGMTIGEFAVKLLIEEDPYVLMVYHHGVRPEQQAAIIRETIRHPGMMVASDGIYHGSFSHPRGYGCFARTLRLCVREMGAVSLEEAIYKMSGFPAERFLVPDRGLLRPGYGADVVIFDPETVADGSTWDQPFAEPVGIDRVIVNGHTLILDGRPTGALPGRVLRRKR